MRKQLLRISMFVALALLLVIAAVQVVLWTDWPRRRVLEELQSKSGLVVNAASLRSGWFGHSTLRGVSVRLPMADKPFANVPTMSVEHTALLPFVFGSGMRIDSVQIANPELTIVQDQSGGWNIQRVADVLRGRLRNGGTGSPAGAPPSLPAIEISNATITLTNAGGRSVTMQNASFSGKSNGPLIWAFTGEVPSHLQVHGRVSTGGGWAHEINFDLNDLHEPLAIAVGPTAPDPLSAKGEWRGQLTAGQLDGIVQLEQAQIGETTLAGDVSILIAGASVSVSNPNLTVQNPSQPLGPIHIAGGDVQLNDRKLAITELKVNARDLDAMLSADGDLASRSGTIDARWTGSVASAGVEHRGTLHAAIESPEIGQHRLNASIQSSETIPGGKLLADFDLAVSGSDWKVLQARVVSPQLRWQNDQKSVDLSGVSIEAKLNWPVVNLTNLHAPNAESQMTGRFNFDDQAWNLDASVNKWKLPMQGFEVPTSPIDITVLASGNLQQVEVSNIEVNGELIRLSGNATYDEGADIPLKAQTTFAYHIPGQSNAAAASQPASTQPAATQQQTAGALKAQLNLQGEIQPLKIDFQGNLTGENVPLASGTLPAIAMPVQGTLDSQLTTFRAADIQILGGVVSLNGVYRPETSLMDIQLEGDKLALPQLATLVGSPIAIEGTIATKAEIKLPPRKPEELVISGTWESHDLTTRAGSFSHAAGNVRSQQNQVDLTDIHLTSADDSGTITGSAVFDRSKHRLKVTMQSEQWPARLPDRDVALVMNGQAAFEYDLKSDSVFGAGNLKSDMRISGKQLGVIDASVSAKDRTVSLNSIEATLLDGTAHGSGRFSIDDFTNSTGELAWRDIDLALIARFIPALVSLEGTVSGEAKLMQDGSSRARGPMHITMSMQSNNARSRTVTLGDMQLSAYTGNGELTIDNAHLQLAGGEFDIWAKLTRHGSEPFTHVNVDYKEVQLDQLAHWFKPEMKTVPGLLYGSIAAGGYLTEPHRLFGQADVNIEQSDLVNVPVFSLIHGALNFQLGQIEPKGSGRANIRLEGDSLSMTRLEYFNRGVDIVGAAQIEDIWKAKESPVSGVAVGAMRPLKDINLPFFSDIDRAIKAIQTGAVSVSIDGTLGEPQDKIVPFAEISNAFQRIIGGAPQ